MPSRTIGVLIVLAIAVGVGCVALGEYAGSVANIPAQDAAIDYLIGVVWGGVLLLLLWSLLPLDPLLKWPLTWIWLIRCAVALGPMLWYEGHYNNLDAYYYFDYVYNPLNARNATGFVPGTDFFISVMYGAKVLLPSSYHAWKLTFSFIGLIGTYLFFSGTRMMFPRVPIKYLVFLNLYPSIVFWSSILGKDPLVLFGMSVYYYGAVGLITRRQSFRYLLVTLVGAMIAVSVRPWLGLVTGGPLLILGFASVRQVKVKVSVALTALFGVVAATQVFADRFAVFSVGSLIDTVNRISGTFSVGNSARYMPAFSTIGEMIGFLPIGVFTALYRPLPGEVATVFGTLAGLENAILLAATVRLAMPMWRVGVRSLLGRWLVVVVLFWAVMYAFASYHNAGDAVRFKLQVLPFLLVLLCMAARVGGFCVSVRRSI